MYAVVVTLAATSPEPLPHVTVDGTTVRAEWSDGRVGHLRLEEA